MSIKVTIGNNDIVSAYIDENTHKKSGLKLKNYAKIKISIICASILYNAKMRQGRVIPAFFVA